MTHRDPADVILSVADVYADIAGVFTDHLDRHYLARPNVEHWSVGMNRALKFRDSGADQRFYDIDFRAMQADPIGEVRGLYAWFAERPGNPARRDAASFWVFGDRGEVGLPRVGIEAVAANWEAHGIQVNVAFPDGRAFRLRQDGKTWPAEGPEGLPTVLGAGPLSFRCAEPFRTWTMTFAGPMVQTSSVDLAEGKKDRPLVHVGFEVEATIATPPWIQGALRAAAAAQLASSIEADLIGAPPYEQLVRATGSLPL